MSEHTVSIADVFKDAVIVPASSARVGDYHGSSEPSWACGYHWTYWPNLVFTQKGLTLTAD